jgi:protein SCO1
MNFLFMGIRFFVAAVIVLVNLQQVLASEVTQVRADKTVLALPEIRILSMQEKSSSLKSELDTDGPVIVNFVFTTCSTICSIQTLVLSQAQQQLDASDLKAKILTFSIDPDNDTPSQIRKFASTFSVGKSWMFYTGSYDAMLTVQKTFNAYRGSKANHPPVMFMRKNKSAPWMRIEGFPKPQEVVALLRALPSK